MSVDIDTVKRVARLARIAVTDEDAGRMTGELNAILGFVEQLNEVDVEGVEPIEVAVHEAGTETDGVPFAQIFVDARRGGIEAFFVAVELAVVVEVVHADFESVFDQAIE